MLKQAPSTARYLYQTTAMSSIIRERVGIRNHVSKQSPVERHNHIEIIGVRSFCTRYRENLASIPLFLATITSTAQTLREMMSANGSLVRH